MKTTIQPGPTQKVLALWSPLTVALDALQPLAALAARIHVAQVFFLSGLTKLRDWETTVLLVLGLGRRFAALGLFVVNAVAVIALTDIAPAALQQHIFWGALLAGLAIYGPGTWSLDRLIWPRLMRRQAA